MLYKLHVFKLHKLSWIRNYQNPQQCDPHEIHIYTLHTVQTVSGNTIKHKCTF